MRKTLVNGIATAMVLTFGGLSANPSSAEAVKGSDSPQVFLELIDERGEMAFAAAYGPAVVSQDYRINEEEDVVPAIGLSCVAAVTFVGGLLHTIVRSQRTDNESNQPDGCQPRMPLEENTSVPSSLNEDMPQEESRPMTNDTSQQPVSQHKRSPRIWNSLSFLCLCSIAGLVVCVCLIILLVALNQRRLPHGISYWDERYFSESVMATSVMGAVLSGVTFCGGIVLSVLQDRRGRMNPPHATDKKIRRSVLLYGLMTGVCIWGWLGTDVGVSQCFDNLDKQFVFNTIVDCFVFVLAILGLLPAIVVAIFHRNGKK